MIKAADDLEADLGQGEGVSEASGDGTSVDGPPSNDQVGGGFCVLPTYDKNLINA